MGPVGALLLAAGESRRMGTLKALLPWRDTTLLRHQVSTLQQAGLSPIVVVVGHRAPEVESHIANVSGVQTVHNPHYMEGKTTSIKVTNRKNDKIAVSLYSNGKMLVQKTQTLRPGSYMVLAGNTGTDSAWFIVLSKDK